MPLTGIPHQNFFDFGAFDDVAHFLAHTRTRVLSVHGAARAWF
ncbi:hypothetical protein ACP_0436 [Acidobacterium capsulatum ATCC 51196]|uniref:Uncharacterized protein n=1 Tax=Acidobacterium capsulatum (strain ATCC 51196 / DSM 11244 / BCRC 80197 / JCM 7670 / NBRC 15755 / NCIMB 13165 / 161) TaxID=240015 RepID=C1F0T9_ACIC5|nr:hypothetical protein ACP_0436 [Acidobacterium capsulatum ATCC 51196]